MFKDFKNTPEEWLKVFDAQKKWLEECSIDNAKRSKAEVFMSLIDFVTYDSALDEELAPRYLAVLKSILERTTYEFQDASHQNNIDFLVVCNLPCFKGRLSWGVSIRGAMFDLYYKRQAFDFYNELPATDGDEECHLMCDTTEKYVAYIQGLIMWMEKEE